MKKSDYQRLMAICYQIAGSICLLPEHSSDDEVELLLNTLSNPEGAGARLLLENSDNHKSFQEVTLRCIEAELKETEK